jgi:glutamyl/glutaminyl-tRNA synthetase
LAWRACAVEKFRKSNNLMSTVVTRFAPSPTGYLHFGGARTALFSWLYARHTGGKYYLRIEDTDLARSTQQAVDQLIEDLTWLGLKWDNPVLMFQSKRLSIYNRIIDGLIANGQAYRAYETNEELAAQRRIAEREKRSFLYRRPKLTDEQVKQYEAENRPHVVRFAMPVKEYRFTDVVLGKDVVMPANECQDFVIRKTDGMPTYHFGVVVDDAEMGITHVMRGGEHLKNTFYHMALQEALGYPRPIYAHLTTIQNPDGTKMGKRDRDKKVRHFVGLYLKKPGHTEDELARAFDLAMRGRLTDKAIGELLQLDNGSSYENRLRLWIKEDNRQLASDEQILLTGLAGFNEKDLPEVSIHDFRLNGYLPEALLNFIALLGWSPGGDREIMSVKELIDLFSLDRVGVANPKFDRAKLLDFNTKICGAATNERLVAAMKDMLAIDDGSPMKSASDADLSRVIHMKRGFRTLREVEESCRFFFIADEAVVYDPSAVGKVLKKNDGQGMMVLRELKDRLAGMQEWTHQAVEAMVNAYCAEKNLQLGKVAQPIRVAISGGTVSPPIFESVEFLGKERTVARIERCINAVS